MSISLADALRQVDLRSGAVYQCQVGRFRVEVRVDDTVPDTVLTPLAPSDVMLDPWTEFPELSPAAMVQVVPAPPVLPDIPDLPTDAAP